MCIYCGTMNYRKIYENHFGPIPIDELGRKYDIHHIDGNRNNNNIVNLIAIKIQEHYDIHYSQNDYGACWLIARKIKLSPEEISKLATLNANKRVTDNNHHFLGGEIQRALNKKLLENKTHNLLGGEISRKINKERVENKSHNLLGENNPCHERLKNGTHHNFIEYTCPHCNRTGKGPRFKSCHFDNCKCLVQFSI